MRSSPTTYRNYLIFNEAQTDAEMNKNIWIPQLAQRTRRELQGSRKVCAWE